VLVVKNTAAVDAVREVRLELGGDATYVGTGDGGMQAVAGGTLIADATPAAMWDSTKPVTNGRPQEGPDPEPSTHRAPGDAAKVATIATRVDGDDLVLRPDPAMLGAPASAFPLFLDPAWSAGKKRWAYATNNNTNNTDVSVARVGKDPKGGRIYRSFSSSPPQP
jgi:hypothetical protein